MDNHDGGDSKDDLDGDSGVAMAGEDDHDVGNAEGDATTVARRLFC